MAKTLVESILEARDADIERDRQRADVLRGGPGDLVSMLALIGALKARSQRVTYVVRADGGKGRIIRILGNGFDYNVQEADPLIRDNRYAFYWLALGETEPAYFHTVMPELPTLGHFQTNPDFTKLNNLEQARIAFSDALSRSSWPNR